ncbi:MULTISPECIES: hypothetical protein [Lactobacillales]|uniref:hypothetical protein n=1 Tax=Lactobacillales TaxID=186826 RepID=UPI002FC9C3DE
MKKFNVMYDKNKGSLESMWLLFSLIVISIMTFEGMYLKAIFGLIVICFYGISKCVKYLNQIVVTNYYIYITLEKMIKGTENEK